MHTIQANISEEWELKIKLTCVFTRAYNFSITNNLITSVFVERQIICSPWCLCSVNRSNISWYSSGYFGVSLVRRWKVCLDRYACDGPWTQSISPYSRVISELFSTASASVSTLSWKIILYDEWRVFGMMNLIRNPLIIDFGKRLFVAMSYSMVQFGSISIHDRTGSLNVYNKQSAFHCF